MTPWIGWITVKIRLLLEKVELLVLPLFGRGLLYQDKLVSEAYIWYAHVMGLWYPYTCRSPVAMQCPYSKWVMMKPLCMLNICIHAEIYTHVLHTYLIYPCISQPSYPKIWLPWNFSPFMFPPVLPSTQDALLRASDAQLAAKMQTLAQRWPRSDSSRVSMQVATENDGLIWVENL